MQSKNMDYTITDKRKYNKRKKIFDRMVERKISMSSDNYETHLTDLMRLDAYYIKENMDLIEDAINAPRGARYLLIPLSLSGGIFEYDRQTRECSINRPFDYIKMKIDLEKIKL